jgi:hypothetical protein
MMVGTQGCVPQKKTTSGLASVPQWQIQESSKNNLIVKGSVNYMIKVH